MLHHHNDDPQWPGYALTPYALAVSHGYRGTREEYEALMARREEEMTGSVRGDIPQTLTAGEKVRALDNIGFGNVTGMRMEM